MSKLLDKYEKQNQEKGKEIEEKKLKIKTSASRIKSKYVQINVSEESRKKLNEFARLHNQKIVGLFDEMLELLFEKYDYKD